MLVLALLGLTILVFSGAGVGLLKLAVIGRRKATTRCYECRYDLRGCPTGSILCPECGVVICAPGSRPPASARTRLWAAACALVLLMPLTTGMIWGWRIFRESSLYGRYFPRGLLREALADPQRAPAADSAIASVLESYGHGGSSDTTMRLAVRAAVAQLADHSGQPAKPRSDDDEGYINGSTSSEWTGAAAGVLDDSAVNPERQSKVLAAFLDEYERTPLVMSTQVDEILCDLVSGRRFERYSGSSNDYQPASGQPRPLGAAEQQRAIEVLLAIQGDRNRRWEERWGMALEHAWQNEQLSREQIERYLRQSCAPTVRVVSGSPPLTGDAVVVEFVPHWRSGTHMPVWARMTTSGPDWEGRLSGPITRGIVDYHGGRSNNSECRGVLLLPDKVGLVTLNVLVEYGFGEAVVDSLKRRVNPFDHQGYEKLWRSMPTVKFSMPVEVVFDLAATDANRVEMVDGGLSSQDLALRVDSDSGIQCARRGDGREEYLLVVNPRTKAIDVAFDAFLRQDGVEHSLGWAFHRRIDRDPMLYRNVVSGIDPSRPVDVVLRCSVGKLERPAMSPRIWNGECTLQGLKVKLRTKPELLGAYEEEK